MKIRVYQKMDGTVALCSVPVRDGIQNFDSAKLPDYLSGLPFAEIEQNVLPQVEYQEQIYFDGECIKENLKVDQPWEVQLMPPVLIKQKHLEKKEAELDAELEKQNPNPIKVIKFFREIEKTKKKKDGDLYQTALTNLDEKVAAGEPDKPVIRQKLLVKING